MRRHLVFGFVFVAAVSFGSLAACGKVATVQVEGCKTDDDCALTTRQENCCSGCASIAGTKASIAEREESCKGKPGGPPRCPSLDCRRLTQTAACTAGRCVGVNKEPQ